MTQIIGTSVTAANHPGEGLRRALSLGRESRAGPGSLVPFAGAVA